MAWAGEISTKPFGPTPVEKHSCEMKTSILLGAFCLVLSQLDFGEASPVGVVDDNNENNGIENLVVSISV